VDSKDLFSTNERDTQSAFEAGLGYQVGLSSRWYAPLKFEEQVQGNQVATNLSAVTNTQLTTSLPFDVPLKWGVIDAPMPPASAQGRERLTPRSRRAASHE
jgi:hypothetical protein